MDMKPIFSNEFLMVQLDEQYNVLYWEWTTRDQEFTDEQFLSHCHILLDYVLDFHCAYLLENAYNSRFKISVELQEKFANEILIHLNDVVKKMAVVNSSELVTSMSNEQWYDEVDDKQFTDRYFSSLDEAKRWLYKSIAK
jgi:hypothetical protein